MTIEDVIREFKQQRDDLSLLRRDIERLEDRVYELEIERV